MPTSGHNPTSPAQAASPPCRNREGSDPPHPRNRSRCRRPRGGRSRHAAPRRTTPRPRRLRRVPGADRRRPSATADSVRRSHAGAHGDRDGRAHPRPRDTATHGADRDPARAATRRHDRRPPAPTDARSAGRPRPPRRLRPRRRPPPRRRPRSKRTQADEVAPPNGQAPSPRSTPRPRPQPQLRVRQGQADEDATHGSGHLGPRAEAHQHRRQPRRRRTRATRSRLPGPAKIGVPNFFIDKFRIPPFLLPIYQAAGMQYGIRWEVLAGINEIETDYGRNLNVSSAGALGWMQFMPSTWKQYGVDANQDGVKDPFNPVDAIFAAARYLKAAGGDTDIRKGDLRLQPRRLVRRLGPDARPGRRRHPGRPRRLAHGPHPGSLPGPRQGDLRRRAEEGRPQDQGRQRRRRRSSPTPRARTSRSSPRPARP